MSTHKRTELESRHVIVSGATGFVGQHLVPILLENNYEVIATARDLKKAKLFPWFRSVKFVSLDFYKEKASLSVPQGAGLIHLAWQGLPNYMSLSHFEDNLPHNYNFVKSLVSLGVRQVLAIGTCMEYGFQSGAIPSTSQPLPNNPYGLAKNNLRRYLEFLATTQPFTLQWARLFYLYGTGQSAGSILSQLDASIDNNASEFNMSAGEQLRDYLPVEEAARQLCELYSKGTPGVFNVCSGRPISVRRLVERRIKQRGSDIKPNLGFFPYTNYEPMAFWGVRDIGQTLYLPTLPNSPLREKAVENSLAPVRLRYNKSLQFLENEAFEPELIDYSQNYENSQAHSKTFLNHMSTVLQLLKRARPKGAVMVEVGCGKGDFIELAHRDGYFNVRGFDASYQGKSSLIEKRYLNPADRISADLVVLRHVLEHIPRPFEFLSTLRAIFGDAYIYIEVPNYDWIEANQTFFDITYEHVNYFSQRALKALFNPAQTEHGLLFEQQYQYVISKLAALDSNFDREYRSSDWRYTTFEDIFPNMWRAIERFNTLAKSRSVFVWGAATKGCLFLAHCAEIGILVDKVRFAVDLNSGKVGKFLPGSLVEIKAKSDFFDYAKPGDLVIVSNPAYRDEIVAEIRGAGLIDIEVETL